MDLGATICLARIPRCDVCPLAAACPSRGTRRAGKEAVAIPRILPPAPRGDRCGSSQTGRGRASGLDAEAVRALQRTGSWSWSGGSRAPPRSSTGYPPAS